jgi:threonine dehydrogenase-like Zn-dependent dehydrogenase
MASMRAGTIPTGGLCTHRMILQDVPGGFPELLDPERAVVKAMIEIP